MASHGRARRDGDDEGDRRVAGPRPAVLLAGVLGIAFLTHLGVLDNAFQYDDAHSVVDNPHIRSLAAPWAFFTDPTTFSARPERAMFRPLVVLSYAAQSALGAREAGQFLRANLVLHLLCAALVFALARGLNLAPWAAAAASLLFAVHPVNAEVVNYVSSRSESLAAAGVLGALVGYQYWRRQAGPVWSGVSLVAGAGALLAKASAVVLPALLWVQEAHTAAGRRWWRPVPAAILASGYVVIVADLAGTALGAPVRPLTEQLWTQLKAGPYYAYLLLMPVRLTVEHAFTAAPAPWSGPVLLSAALVVSLAVVVYRLASLPRTLVLWALLALAPASLVPLNVLVNEHRLYLPSACLALLAASALRCGPVGWGWSRRIPGVLLLVGVGLLAVLAQQRSTVWDSAVSLWSEAVARAPAAYRAHLHLGGALEEAGDAAGALAQFREAAGLAPGVPETQYNLGRGLLAAGDTLGARRAWTQSLEVGPDFLDAQLNLASLEQDRGAFAAARQLLSRAAAAHPEAAAEVWRRRGVLERKAGDTAAARTAYETSLRLDPGRAETYYNLGNLEFETRGPEAAVAHYQAALRCDPGHAEAAYNLADTWLRLGDAAAAEGVCRQVLSRIGALRRPPALSKLLLPLAQALEAQGRLADAAQAYRSFLASGVAPGRLGAQVRRHLEQLESDPGEGQRR